MPDGGYNDDGPPLTVADAGKVLGYSRATMYEMVKLRKIGYVRAGNMDIRIFPRHIRDFIRRHECPALDSNGPPTSSSKGQENGNGTSPGRMKYQDAAATQARALRFKARSQQKKPRHT